MNSQQKHHSQKQNKHITKIRRQQIINKLLNIIINSTTLLNSNHQRRKIIIQQDHISSFLSNIRSRTHSNTKISTLCAGETLAKISTSTAIFCKEASSKASNSSPVKQRSRKPI